MLVQTRVKKRKDVSAKWEEIREGHVEGMKRARFPAGAAPMRAFANVSFPDVLPLCRHVLALLYTGLNQHCPKTSWRD